MGNNTLSIWVNNTALNKSLQPDSGLSWWVWALIAIGAVIIFIVIIALIMYAISKSKKKKATKDV